MTFHPSAIPLIQAPMAGAQGPELAIAVCKAGGLGSLPAALLTPERLREQIAAVRRETNASFNVNFFCHAEPTPNPEIEARWREQLAAYYGEAGIDLSAVPAEPVRTPFGEAMCALIEETRPAVVSFHFGLPAAPLLARVKATGALGPFIRHDRCRGALARTQGSRRHHRAGPRSGRASRHVPI
jgi:nitronate monooxygenase